MRFSIFLTTVLAMMMTNVAEAAEHKASLFLSETAGLHSLTVGDQMSNMQIDQHPDIPIGILFGIASNSGASYQIVRNKKVLAKGVFADNGFGGKVEYAAAYISTNDYCSDIRIVVLDAKGKNISTSTVYFQCME